LYCPKNLNDPPMRSGFEKLKLLLINRKVQFFSKYLYFDHLELSFYEHNKKVKEKEINPQLTGSKIRFVVVDHFGVVNLGRC